MFFRFVRFALVGLLFLFGCAASVHAQTTITVNSTAQEVTLANPSGIVNGNCTLGEAILAAITDTAVDACPAGQSGAKDIIVIPAGTYTLTSAAVGAYALGDASNLVLQGAGAATTIIERSSAAGTPDFIFLGITNVDITGLTFRNGKGSTVEGGAIQSKGGNTITACVFDSNWTHLYGGAIRNLTGSLTIHDSVFTNNISINVGGAIFSATPRGAPSPTTVTIVNSTFSGNQAPGTAGGAIYCSRNGWTSCDGLTVTDSTFVNNSAGWAGAINVDDNLIVTRSLFVGNRGQTFGGAIVATGPVNGIIRDSYFQNNTAGTSCGAINGRVNVSGSTFDGNYVGAGQGNGGAMVVYSGTIVNSTFTGNRSGNGGTLDSGGGSTFNNITVTNNSNTSGGIVGFRNSTDTIRNSIVAANNPGSADCGGPGTSLGHNIIGVNCGLTAAAGDQLGTSAAPIEPLLSGLDGTSGILAGSNVGGQAPVVVPAHNLMTSSPALNVGDPGTPDGVSPHCEVNDQRGRARPVGSGCDTGAIEDPTGTGVTPNFDLSVFNGGWPNPATVNNNVTYNISVNNGGPDPAPAVVLTDQLASGVTFVSATLFNAPTGTCSQAAGTVTCNLGVMHMNGVSVDIVVTPTSTATSPMLNTASATATGTDLNPANNSAVASIVISGNAADVGLTNAGAPNPINLGAGNVTYTLTVSNAGPSTANNVVVTDTLPGSATFVSATASQGACPAPAGGVLTCNLGAITNGMNATITVVVTPTATGTLTNSSSVTATETDPNPANNSANASTTVNASADLSVTVTDAPDPVALNSNITYTITVANAGPSAATSTVLTDTLAASVTYVSASSSQGSCANAGTTVTCNLGTVNSGANATVTIVARAGTVGTASNSASVTSGVTDPVSANNSAATTTTVNPAAATDFSLTLTPVTQDVRPGATATYTIALNSLPAGTSFNNAIALSCSTSPSIGTCVVSPASVTPGANPGAATVTVSIPQSGLVPGAPRGPQLPGFRPMWLTLFGAMMVACALLSLRRKQRWTARATTLALALLVLALAVGQSACTNGFSAFGPYQLTVTATSGSLSHSATATVNVTH